MLKNKEIQKEGIPDEREAQKFICDWDEDTCPDATENLNCLKLAREHEEEPMVQWEIDKINEWNLTIEEVAHYPRLIKQFTTYESATTKYDICRTCDKRYSYMRWSDGSIRCMNCTWDVMMGEIIRLHKNIPDSFDPNGLYEKNLSLLPHNVNGDIF